MAQFKIERLKWGNDETGFDYCISISKIVFEKDETEIVLPSHYEGEPITHVGYVQDYTPAHEHWHDWHHPSQGSEWVPEKYSYSGATIFVPKSLKKLIVPATVTNFCDYAFENIDKVMIEVDPENTVYCSGKGQIKNKRR